MKIAGLQKLTLLDFPERTAATVFTPGCNLRCPFCHNAALVVGDERATGPTISLEEFFAFLDARQGLLDGICITGGEPLIQPGIKEFCEQIKARSYAVKLDTNGCFPEKMAELIEAGLVDYVAMDIKNSPARYGETAGMPELDITPLQESITYLLAGKLPYEFRTTVVREFHTEEDLVVLAKWIQGARAWYLQGFEDGEGVLAGMDVLHGYRPEELAAMLPRLQSVIPSTFLRGV